MNNHPERWSVFLSLNTIWAEIQIIENLRNQSKEEFSMSKIPKDIINQLLKDFPNNYDYQQAISFVNHVRTDSLNVGWIQLTRALIILSAGDINKMRDLVQSNYMGDPRDLIMAMMKQAQTKNDYGSTPFTT